MANVVLQVEKNSEENKSHPSSKINHILAHLYAVPLVYIFISCMKVNCYFALLTIVSLSTVKLSMIFKKYTIMLVCP